jgi:DNA uptake protein ComE-like DNA-binding protein
LDVGRVIPCPSKVTHGLEKGIEMSSILLLAMNLKRAGLTALLVGVVGLGLAACGEATPAQPTSTPTVAIETESAPTATVETTPAGSDSGGVSTAPTPTAESTGDSGQRVACTKLNLNALTEAELTATIPNFSSRMVREFFEYRPYVSIQQFRQEIGKYVDENQVAEYEKYVYVPIDPNASDAATLIQLPGVDEAIAAQLVAARPYESNEAFIEALGAQVGDEQATAAYCFLSANQ